MQIPNYPFKSVHDFILTYIVPQILSRRWKWFVQDTNKLNFGIGASGIVGKAAPTTNTLALQDGEVSSIQGLLGYLNCKAKDTYIVHLLLVLKRMIQVGRTTLRVLFQY